MQVATDADVKAMLGIDPLPKLGDFELVHMSGKVGSVIRVLQFLNGDGFRDYEHARLYVGNGKCLDAGPSGAKLGDLHQYDNVSHVWSTGVIPLTADQRFAIAVEGRKLVGTRYSFADYGSLAAKRLHIWVPGLDAYVASSKHMICSQAVAYAYMMGGYPLYSTFTGNVTPGDLAEWLAQHGKPC